MMNATAEAAYLTALDSFRLIALAHTAVTLRYRRGEIGDAAFLASRASQEDASRRLDAAEYELLKADRNTIGDEAR